MGFWEEISNFMGNLGGYIEAFLEGLIDGILAPFIELIGATFLLSLVSGVQVTLSTMPPSEMVYFLAFGLTFAVIISSIVTYVLYYRGAFDSPVYFLGFLFGMGALLTSAIKIQDFQQISNMIAIILVIAAGIITKIWVYLKIKNN